MIELKNITKTFETSSGRVEALDNVSLTVEDGEIYGIIGMSGAGKSTLVRCINMLERPTDGQVIFDGVDLGSLSEKRLREVRRKITMIFQGFNLLAQRTVLKNICYPLEIAKVPSHEAKKRAKELLELVGLSDKANSYPAQLSGGQKQRVAIARALATNPKVLLCDEATSALDPNTTRSILQLLKDINKKMNVTIVVITHEMKVIEQICNKVAVIDKSHIVEQGSVKEIFMRPKSQIAKELILPKTEAIERMAGKKCIRIVFDGASAFEPTISNLAFECHAAVNILAANTQTIDGIAYGQMVLQLPESEEDSKRVLEYLKNKNLIYKEEERKDDTINN